MTQNETGQLEKFCDENQTSLYLETSFTETRNAKRVEIPTASTHSDCEISTDTALDVISENVNDVSVTEIYDETIFAVGLNEENISPNINPDEPTNKIVLKKSHKKHASIEMKFRCFVINWDKVSDKVIQRLNYLQAFKDNNPKVAVPCSIRFSKTDLNDLVNVVVDQLRMIDTQIAAKTMESVAKMIFTKFPCLDFEDDDGFGGGNGHIALKYKMINRNTYLNRFKDPNIPHVSSGQTRRRSNIRAGTVKEYWEKSTKDCASDVLSKLLRNEPDLLTPSFLIETQAYIRNRIDENKKLSTLIMDFPVLRRRKLVHYHFEQCTGIDAKSLENYFLMKRQKIISFSKTRPKKLHLTETCTDIQIFQFLCSLVGDEWSELLCVKELGTRLEGIVTNSPSPMLVEIDMGNTSMYYVYAEKTRLSEGTAQIKCALMDLLAVYYVHNFMYKKTISKFLEFIQQYFCKIISFEGSKSQAVRIGRQLRIVNKIIKAISNHVVE
ncbi:uncharacterized protein LOC129727479 [Wyeomyia smithii]|uniref:uncharacterized protein LOC129727479 n=1 Tax=Wyeomyia smithii TaxID=174621 RepID=UPI002467ADA4|nr:uncharacterized protein LOC129727479 [Wyeomyia smithii]